jgi:hypothetical protein
LPAAVEQNAQIYFKHRCCHLTSPLCIVVGTCYCLQEEQDVDPSSGTRSRSSNIKLSGTSCCVLGPDNWLRQKLAQLTTHKQFENFILLLIFFSSSILALEMPSLDHDGLFFNTLEYIDMAFVVLFALEALVKILVRGFVANGPGSYLHNPWNMLDFFIVVLGKYLDTAL